MATASTRVSFIKKSNTKTYFLNPKNKIYTSVIYVLLHVEYGDNEKIKLYWFQNIVA